MEQVARRVSATSIIAGFKTQLDKASWYEPALSRRLHWRSLEIPSNLNYPTVLSYKHLPVCLSCTSLGSLEIDVSLLSWNGTPQRKAASKELGLREDLL